MNKQVNAERLEQMIRDGCKYANSLSSIAASDSWEYAVAAYLLGRLEIVERHIEGAAPA